jgi:DNA-binding MarR family transcriptional regulator
MRGIEEELQTSKFQSEIHKAHVNILFTANWLNERIISALKPFNLTPEQFNVLRILRGQHPKTIRIKDITYRMLERNSNTTRIIDRLEAKNLALRKQSGDDGRERYVEITEEGIKILNLVDQEWAKKSPHECSTTADDAKTINAILDRMRH